MQGSPGVRSAASTWLHLRLVLRSQVSHRFDWPTKTVHVLNLNCVKIAVRREGRISDCAILWKGREIFAVVELKGGDTAVKIDIAVQQIQAGVRLVGDLVWDQHVTDFFPILMYRRRDPTRALNGTSRGRSLEIFWWL